jgi:hypothetical protein
MERKKMTFEVLEEVIANFLNKVLENKKPSWR